MIDFERRLNRNLKSLTINNIDSYMDRLGESLFEAAYLVARWIITDCEVQIPEDYDMENWENNIANYLVGIFHDQLADPDPEHRWKTEVEPEVWHEQQ